MAFLKKTIVLLLNQNEKMKKLVLMLAVVFSMSFFACGNKEAAAETEAAAEDTVAVVAEEVAVAVDTVAGDTAVVAEVAEAAAPAVAE